MKFVADENVDKQIVDELRGQGHEVFYVAELDPGIHDNVVLAKSVGAGAVLVTADKDFGEIVFRQRRVSTGVLLLRLAGVSSETKALRVAGVVKEYGAKLVGGFSVLTITNLRIRRDLVEKLNAEIQAKQPRGDKVP